MTTLIRLLVLSALMSGIARDARAEGLSGPNPHECASEIARTAEEQMTLFDDGRGTDYVLEKTDNICGLDNPRQLTNPAVVDYDKLMEATKEIRQMKKEKIAEDSAKGIQLRTAAEARVRKACKEVMTSKSHCSVWKKIKRRDGKKLPDITKTVKKKITGS